MAKVTKDMIIGDVVRTYPELVPTFVQNGMHCIGCPSAQAESIEDACFVHGLDPDQMIEALNSAE